MLEPTKPSIESRKRVRSLLGLWRTCDELQREYPDGMIMLMDGSAPFDILLIDAGSESVVAVEVKAAASTSAAARSLSPMQKELGRILDSKLKWKVTMNKYVMYGEPGPEISVRKVP